MNKYLVLLDDSKQIQFNKDLLTNNCNAFQPLHYSVYQSFYFIDGTGYMKTVQDEIEFVLYGYEKQGINLLPMNDFIKSYQLEKYLDYDISHLSGGWKKYLGLALFTNQRSEGKIYFDFTRQLSDRLINSIITNIERSACKTAFFFEYDITLLKDYKFKKLMSSNNGFEDINQSALTKINTETNFDPNEIL